MEFRLLGATEVTDGGRPVDLPSGRARALLTILALRCGHPVPAERLIDELWSGSPPPTATTVVHGLVSKLRRALSAHREDAPPVLETVGSGYRLAADPECVDAIRFEQLVAAARGEDPATKAATLTRALALWRGPALADFGYEPFAQRTITALEESRVQAHEDLLDAELSLGRAEDVVPRLRALVEANPFRERLHGLLMTALYRSGRQADALAAYSTARRLLHEELGIEPGPALQALEAAVLRQDEALAAPPQTRPPPPAGEPGWLPQERRRVTVAVVDVSASGDEGTDAESLARVGAESAEVAAGVLAAHGARVERSLGDELVAFFGFPASREDDALRAVRGVLDSRLRVCSRDGVDGVRPALHAGVETGDIVIAGPGGRLPDHVTGPVISTARRLALSAVRDDVVLGPATLPLVRGSVIVRPGDDATGWVVLELATGAEPIPHGPELPMVGREQEISRLRTAYRRAVRSSAPVRVTVVGEAGIGKSRLARELVASLGQGARVLTIRCPPPEEPLGFHPVRQAVVEAAGVLGWRGLHDALADRADGTAALDEVAPGIGLRCPPATARQLAAPMLRLLETLAARTPLVVVLDDLHWATPAYVDLLGRLEDMAGRVLLLGLTRSVDDETPTTETLRLEPMTDSDVARLVISQGGPVTPGALQRVVQLAQGNPLYVRQLLAASDDAELDTVPATLAGLLSMRLDRLGPGERDVLRCAAVTGLDVDAAAVRDLLPPEAEPFVTAHLDGLVRKRFLDRTPDGLRFAHGLLQLAALQSLTFQDRARLQAALEARGADAPVGREGLEPA